MISALLRNRKKYHNLSFLLFKFSIYMPTAHRYSYYIQYMSTIDDSLPAFACSEVYRDFKDIK